jgi:hypothetical protein
MMSSRLCAVALSAALSVVSPAWAGGPSFALDHFNAYLASGSAAVGPVQLTDQFGSVSTALGLADFFMVPASKNGEGIQDPFSHLTCYQIADPSPNAAPDVIATNQFRAPQLALGLQRYLCAPTEKLIEPGPVGIDHYLCYDALGPALAAGVSTVDQFQGFATTLLSPLLFCNPVDKNGEGIANPDDHMACYQNSVPGGPIGPIPILNQFEPIPVQISLDEPILMCVPSQKQVLGPEPVEHFALYLAVGPDGPVVSIDDQFGSQVTDLGVVDHFMVPLDKNLEGVADPFSHLTCNQIVDGDPAPSQVIVDNQFGQQTLDLGSPREFCVPTEKLISPGPVSIDHFKCYDASGPSLDIPIDWADQFQGIGVTVRQPILLCNPADKNGEGISNPDDHLVCYNADPPGANIGLIPVLNQFIPAASIDVNEPIGVCVPSSKTLPKGVPSLGTWGVAGLGLLLGALALLSLGRVQRRLAGKG